MKKPDLLILIAVWEFLSAFGILVGILAMSSFYLFAWPSMWMWGDGMWWDMPRMGGAAIFLVSIILFVMVAYFVLALMGGIGLLQGKRWGRILSIAHAALSLFWVPVGTVIGILAIIYLTRADVAEYFASSDQAESSTT
jgi:hypothetical protein